MTDTKEEGGYLSKETLVPLGGILLVGMFVVGGLLSQSERLVNIEYGVSDNTRRIEALNDDVQQGFDDVNARTNDRLYRSQFQAWVDLAKALNQSKNIVWPSIPERE